MTFDPAEHLHRRDNPLRDVVSPHRAKRPWQGQEDAPDAPAPTESDPLFRAKGARGLGRVICFSSDHGKSLPELPLSQIEGIIDTWAAQIAELGATFANVQLFKNKGAMMGCSNPHPHGQVWATVYVQPQFGSPASRYPR